MKVELIRYTPDPEMLVGEAAAICYDGKNPERSLKHAMGNGHTSVSEHASFTFLIDGVSRVLLAQVTRHRLASFSVQSQRYVGVKPVWVVPPKVKAKGFELSYLDMCDKCYQLFCDMVYCGVPAEDARFVIPQGTTCKLMMTMDTRELLHFFSLRCCNRAQWEIRQMAQTMLEQCKAVAPVLFENAGPGCVRGACPEGEKSCKNTE